VAFSSLQVPSEMEFFLVFLFLAHSVGLGDLEDPLDEMAEVAAHRNRLMVVVAAGAYFEGPNLYHAVDHENTDREEGRGLADYIVLDDAR